MAINAWQLTHINQKNGYFLVFLMLAIAIGVNQVSNPWSRFSHVPYGCGATWRQIWRSVWHEKASPKETDMWRIWRVEGFNKTWEWTKVIKNREVSWDLRGIQFLYHAYIHTSMHTYIHYVRTYIRTYIQVPLIMWYLGLWKGVLPRNYNFKREHYDLPLDWTVS